jgi:hypothetical protein
MIGQSSSTGSEAAWSAGWSATEKGCLGRDSGSIQGEGVERGPV